MSEHAIDPSSTLPEFTERAELRARIAIYLGAGGDVRILRKTIAQFGSGLAALLSPTLPARLRSEASSTGMARRVDAVLARTEALGGRWVASGFPGFPSALAQSDVVLLCVAGELPVGPMVTLVGSRDAEEYGLWCARALSGAIAGAGGVVVSGGAKGIDSASHDGAVDGGGRTVVVLGQGLGSALASGQGDAYRRWCDHGAVISEYLPDAHGSKQSFPERNRIVAALGVCTVVVQAAIKSGTLITARLARELGRPVFVIPGEVGQAPCAGSNALIESGEGRALTAPSALAAVTGMPSLSGVSFPSRRGRASTGFLAAEADPVAAMHPAVRFLREAGPQTSTSLVAQFGAEWLGVALELELEGVIRRDAEGRYFA
ncbi:MAG: DNA-processing protein DprA [Myxococcales bacterium]|nr:DNA-processing protein DprA [Myxococcales bacterium]